MTPVMKVAAGSTSTLCVGGGCYYCFKNGKPTNVREWLIWHSYSLMETNDSDEETDKYYWYAVVKRHLVKQNGTEQKEVKDNPDDVPEIDRISDLSLEDDGNDETKKKSNVNNFKGKCRELFSVLERDGEFSSKYKSAQDWCTKESRASRWLLKPTEDPKKRLALASNLSPSSSS